MNMFRFLITTCFCCIVFSVIANSKNETVDVNCNSILPDSARIDSTRNKNVSNVVKLDSLTMAYIEAIYLKMGMNTPRYKMYKTENINILLKLDTATGRVWMVQYGVGKTSAMEVPVDDRSLLSKWEIVKAGRYELYATNNMYNFILLDTEYGFTYQVQWHTDIDKCMRVLIY